MTFSQEAQTWITHYWGLITTPVALLIKSPLPWIIKLLKGENPVDLAQEVQIGVQDFENAVPTIEAVGKGLVDLASKNSTALASDLAPLANIPKLPNLVKLALQSDAVRGLLAQGLVALENWAESALASQQAKAAPANPTPAAPQP